MTSKEKELDKLERAYEEGSVATLARLCGVRFDYLSKHTNEIRTFYNIQKLKILRDSWGEQ